VGTIASSASTTVTPKYSRLRRRLVLGTLALLLVAAGGAWFAVAPDGDGAATEVAAAEARLPDVEPAGPVLATLPAEAPAPDAAVLAGELAPLLAAPALGAGVEARVVDVASDEVLLDQGSENPSTPASTAKLLTAVAALTTLGPDTTLETTVVAGAAPGEVVLVGGGDPTLSRTVPSLTYPGAPTVADLAAQVRSSLPPGTEVTRVVVDSSLFDGPLTAAGWGPGDAPSTYAAPVTATAVDGARVRSGDLPRSGAPGTDAGTALAVALGNPGMPVVLGEAPQGVQTLGTVRSAPVARLVEQALSQSDNLLTESLARHVALARDLPATFEGAAEAVTDALAGAGLDVTGVSLADGSGLSGHRPRAGRPAHRAALRRRGRHAARDLPRPVRPARRRLRRHPVRPRRRGPRDRAGRRASQDRHAARRCTAWPAPWSPRRAGCSSSPWWPDGAPANGEAAEAALDDVASALAACGCR
jgi:D-alanyl-D-alanine carboxypeptidase/D-alanyl-D-alanine-endopeptidase (penicillin-binding protein 4)